jgi:hypothetical protein
MRIVEVSSVAGVYVVELLQQRHDGEEGLFEGLLEGGGGGGGDRVGAVDYLDVHVGLGRLRLRLCLGLSR